MQTPEEHLGSFYLGAEYDIPTGKLVDRPVHFDARDLTTHAVCVGMTGSGKTGLCIGLLEEAAIDKVPTLIIDPKGDMTNLLLQFPDLLPENFLPWINEDDARRKGKNVEDLAASTAEVWKKGLADWGIDPGRIRMLQDSADFTIYTPGSDAGVPVNISGSLQAPGVDFDEHAEAIRERINGTVTALLGLAGINADPVRSREAILLAGIFEYFWRKNENLDLAGLIGSIQKPPVRQVGVFDIDTFFPEKERFGLAMSFNTIIASPTFQSWLTGEPLDVDRMLHTREGKPKHSIFYLAHLSDSERMFFVTLLLENVLTWVRAQTGTSSLRALLYFDEVFGFLPPVAEPSSKRPLLTLLKQARASGLGCVLVTQNPVDLDYKGLTNTGTWFIGKLQAERDKERVLEGLKSAISEAGGENGKTDYDALISQLGNRVFLMHNVHEDRPVVFQTRWAMSYLCGPMQRPQIRKLMASRKKSVAEPAVQGSELPVSPNPSSSPIAERSLSSEGFSIKQPSLEPTVKQFFLPVLISAEEALEQIQKNNGSESITPPLQLVYEPAVIGSASVVFSDRKRNISKQENMLLAFQDFGRNEGAIAWDKAEQLTIQPDSLTAVPDQSAAGFGEVPENANKASELDRFRKSLAEWLYYNARLKLSQHNELDLFRRPEESERDFSIRLQQAAREKRDLEVDQLEKKFAPRLRQLEEKIAREERELAKDEADHESRKAQELIGIGETVLGFFLGRKSSRGISSAVSRRRMTATAKTDVEESREVIEDLRSEIATLEAEMKEMADTIRVKWEHPEAGLVTEELAPKRNDVAVHFATLGWLPFWRTTATLNNQVSRSIAAYEAGGN
ncbi:MAG: DUF87 domain-containing protein [Chlorobium sp.]|jgi:hypothetical protein|nr:DUF87 domain-containing protein [Chlorobium sp.]